MEWKFKQGTESIEVTHGYVCQNIVMNWDDAPHQIYGEVFDVEEDSNEDTFKRMGNMKGKEEFEIFAVAWYLEQGESN